MRVTWTTVLEIASQQRAPKKLYCLLNSSPIHWASLEMVTESKYLLWAGSDQLFSWLLEWISSSSSSMSFKFLSKPIVQPSLCIFMCLQSHMCIQDLFCKLIRYIVVFCWFFLQQHMKAESHIDHTDLCLFEFAFKSFFIMKNANKHHLKTRSNSAIIRQ